MTDVFIFVSLVVMLDDPLLVLASVVLPLVDDGSVVFLVSVDVNTLSTESFDEVGVFLSIDVNEFEDLSSGVLVLGSDDLGLVVVVVSLNGNVVALFVLDLDLTVAIGLQSEHLVVSAVDVPKDGLALALGSLGNVQCSARLFSLDGVELLVGLLVSLPLLLLLLLLLPRVVLLLVLLVSSEHHESSVRLSPHC